MDIMKTENIAEKVKKHYVNWQENTDSVEHSRLPKLAYLRNMKLGRARSR